MCELRRCLSEITENSRPDTHPNLICDLRDQHQHSIEVANGPAPIDRYTCVMHAFDLVEDPEYIAIVEAAPRDIFASSRFVQRLVDNGQMAELPEPEEGALVVYFDDRTVKHIGRLLDQARVESKWGLGHLYQHGLLEVPSSYGSTVRFFRSIDREFALDRYVEYARENGVRFQGDA